MVKSHVSHVAGFMLPFVVGALPPHYAIQLNRERLSKDRLIYCFGFADFRAKAV